MSTGTACESSVQARTAMRTTSSHREYQVTCLISRISRTSESRGMPWAFLSLLVFNKRNTTSNVKTFGQNATRTIYRVIR